MRHFRFIKLIIITLSIAFYSSALAQEYTPIEILNQYYQAVKNKNCAKAIELRPGYSERSCLGITDVAITDLSQLKTEADRAIFLVDIKLSRQSSEEEGKFLGFLALKLHKGKWLIGHDSYARSRENFGVDQYVEWLDSRRNIWFSGAEVPKNRIKQAFEQSKSIQDEIQKSTENSNNPISDSGQMEDKFPSHNPPTPSPLPHHQQKTPVIEATLPVEPGSRKTVKLWQANGPRTFGSMDVMNSCWNAASLLGKPGEKKTRKKGRGAYLKGPKRKRPRLNIAPVPARYAKSIRRVDTGGAKLVALTFDTGERNNDYGGYDAEIVDYLRKNNIKATFYFGGKWLATHQERGMQLIADPRFEMGNHAWTHGNLRVIKGKDMHDQVLFTQAQYEVALERLKKRDCAIQAGVQEIKKIPLMVPTFRYPYGTCSKESLSAVNKMGLPAIQWDVVTSDPVRKQSARAISNIVLKKTKPGSIIIMHSNGRGWNTGKALPMFIPELRKRGYKFVTVSELLRAGKPIATNTCYELRPGDNLRYDKIFGRGTGD